MLNANALFDLLQTNPYRFKESVSSVEGMYSENGFKEDYEANLVNYDEITFEGCSVLPIVRKRYNQLSSLSNCDYALLFDLVIRRLPKTWNGSLYKNNNWLVASANRQKDSEVNILYIKDFNKTILQHLVTDLVANKLTIQSLRKHYSKIPESVVDGVSDRKEIDFKRFLFCNSVLRKFMSKLKPFWDNIQTVPADAKIYVGDAAYFVGERLPTLYSSYNKGLTE